MPVEFDPYYLWLGIPPEEQPPNHYRLLGLRLFEDNREVISYAVDQRAAHLRSFQAGKRSADSQRLLNEVAAAGICLLDAARRKHYDQELRAKLDAANPAASVPPAAASRLPRIPVAKALATEPVTPPALVVQPAASIAPAAPSLGNRTAIIVVLASVAACLLILASGGAVWWWMNPPAPGPIIVQPLPNPSPSPLPSDPSPSPLPPDPSPSPQPPDPAPPPPTSLASRQSWLLSGGAERVIRNVQGSWIEFQPQQQCWLKTTRLTEKFVELTDPRRGIDLRLYDDHLELKSRRQDWATVGPGKWCTESELPAFARELPRRPTTTGPVTLEASSAALSFCGHDWVQVTVPPELRGGTGDWTVETWVRWDPFEPGRGFLNLDGLAANLHTRRIIKADGSAAVAINWSLAGDRDLAVLPSDQWRHVALVRRGVDLILFVDGRESHREKIAANRPLFGPQFTLDKLCGYVRDFRVSKTARYTAPFTPPLHLQADEHALVLLEMKVVRGSTINDLSGHGNTGRRFGTRWTHLTSDAQLSAERADGTLDVLQAFAAAADPLEGNDVLKWPEGKVEAGKPGTRTRVLVPLRAPAEYDVQVDVTRLEGSGSAFLGLTIAGRPAILVIDGLPELGGRVGILPRDASQNSTASTLVPAPATLPAGATVALQAQVRLNGLDGYTVTLQRPNGTSVINGKLADLGGPAEFRIPGQYGLSFGSLDGKFRFDNFRLDPVTADLPTPLLAALGPAGTILPVAAPPASPIASGDRQAWLAANESFALRQSGGRWVEIHDKEVHWFDTLHEINPSYIELKDPRRGVDVRVFADRAELKSARQDWAIVERGAWSPADKLPTFAQRPLSAPQTGPLLRNHLAQALVFGGEQMVIFPTPPGMRGSSSSAADFTIETWLRWSPVQQAGTILAANDSSLVLAAEPTSEGRNGTLRLNWLGPQDLGAIVPDRWTHIALQVNGKNWQLFVGGKLAGSGDNAPEPFAPPALQMGAKQNGFCGIVRDFRMSRGQLYQPNFTPPLKFAAGEQTLTLFEMKASAGRTVKNLAPQGQGAVLDGAQWIPLNNEGQLAAERPDGSVDLIQAFAVLGAPLEGGDVSKWPAKVEAGQPGQQGQRTRMLIPYTPPAEYDLAVSIERLAGEGGAFLGLSVAGRPVILVIDGFPELGGRTGVLPQNLGQVATAAFMPDLPPMLQTGAAMQFTVRVRRQGTDAFSVSLSRPGAKGATFSGKIADARVPPEFQIPLHHCMSFGSLDARVRFTDFILHTVTSAVPLPPPGSGNPPLVGSPPVTPTPPVVAKRQAVPQAGELKAKIDEAREIYQADLKQATKPAQKVALAGTIFKAGEVTKTDQAARYVLFDLARKVYIQAGEVDDALRAAKQLEREFEVPENDLVTATITGLNEAAVVSEQRATLARAAADLADELIAAGQFERADALAAIAALSAGRQKDADLKKEIQQRRALVGRIVKEHTAVKPHLETLAAKPDDLVANLAVGKFHCLVLEDWPLGLPQLVASTDTVYAGPAKLDLEAAGDPAKQLQAAEAWLQIVETDRSSDRDEKLALQRRAKLLLKTPAAVLTGLDQVKAQKRLDALKDVPPGRKGKTASSSGSPSSTPAPAIAAVPAAEAQPLAGLFLGRAARAGGDAGLALSYQLGYMLTDEDIVRLQSAIGSKASNGVQVHLTSTLTLTSDQEMAVLHSRNSGPIGASEVFIGSQRVSRLADGGTAEESRTVMLRRGTHVVRWLLSGDISPGGLLITPANKPAAGAPPVFTLGPDQAMQDAARRLPTRQSLAFGEEP